MQQAEIERLLKPALKELELERQLVHRQIRKNSWLEVLKRLLMVGVLILGSYIAVAIVDHLFFTGLIFLINYVLGSYLLTYGTPLKKNIALEQQFTQRVKQDLFRSIFEQWNSTVDYQPEHFIEKETFRLVSETEQYKFHGGSDYGTGKLEDERSFRFAEMLQPVAVREHTITQRGLFIVLDNSLLIPEHTATIRIRSKGATSSSKVKKKRSKLYLDDVLDTDTLKVTKNLKEDPFTKDFRIENLNRAEILPLLSESWRQQLYQLKRIMRRDVVLVSHNNSCYLWVEHQEKFWNVPVRSSLTEPLVRTTLSWNFARCFVLVDYLSKLTQPTPTS